MLAPFFLLSFTFLLRQAVELAPVVLRPTPRLADARPDREERRGLAAALTFSVEDSFFAL